jgi:hypothetical protein
MLWGDDRIAGVMEPVSIAPRDVRMECLVTVLAILLFAPILVLSPLAARVLEFATEADLDLPTLSVIFGRNPGLTMIVAMVLMGCAILFAWCGRRAAVLMAASLLLQGMVVLLMVAVAIMPWLRLAQEITQ